MKNKLMKLIRENWIYVLLLVVMIFAVSLKTNYQVDEIYSYGLANNVGHTSIHPLWAPFTYENPAEPFLDYMVVETGEPFSIKNVWYNQERESSPPFYYLAVYLACFLFKERFTRWSAASVNLGLIKLALVMFRKILKHFEVKEKELNLFSIFFMISPAIINNVVLFRMYTMFLFEVLFLTYIVLHYRKKENWKFYALMIVGSVLGVLTHYYMIFFVFFLSLLYGISLLMGKEWTKAVKYILSMAVAGVLSYLIFPGIIYHLFDAGRGVEGIQNLQSSFGIHMEQLRNYLGILNRQFFAYRFKDFVHLILGISVIGLFVRRKELKEIILKKVNVDKMWDCLILTIPSICYIIMIAKVAPYVVDRYVMGTFGIIIIVFLLVLKKLLNFCLTDKKIIKVTAMVAICLTTLISINQVFHISYLYLGDKEFLEQMEEYSDVDGLCVTSEGWRISGNFNDMIKLNTLTFFQNEIDTLAQMENLKTKNEYILYVVDNDAEAIIDRIFEICPQITAYEEWGKADVAYMYYLYAE